MPDDTPSDDLPRLRLRVVFAPGRMLGPGKADLLGLIRDTGSISAAGREMGMSYKRAWSLVEEMNAMFSAPLVQSVRGGARGGGAQLTDTGATVLERYRALERAAAEGGRAELAALQGLSATPLPSDMSE
ncbi:winged helix-turn-helix domain-containing protein [Pseudodonghicola xiamenensis]|uniref:Molybdenum-binding transcriptional regulator n=1 Tax=Pseudodonghicola xiamenensis TaxID=337702 RepID=A0A8J3H942_9RHOB|nr:LysR family transcriptional regulator [Pseudodonghicola xiamenensis]GHH02092.1 molybdenum-binding transcriptional regulator [Pseudodonghicola xiamenensis]